MNPWSGFGEKNYLREWGYSLIFSLFLHIVILLVGALSATLCFPRYDLRPFYSVRLVDAPLSAGHTTGPKSTSTGDIGVNAETKKVIGKKLSTGEKLRYEKKIKSLVLKREAMERRRAEREKDLKAALNGLKKQVRPQNSAEIKKALAGILEKIGLEGGTIETRTAITGGGDGSQTSFLSIYLGEIWDKIRDNWVVPAYLLKEKGLETVVVVRIYKSGDIEKTWVEKKSGNVYFDHSAVRAVRLSSPFSPLPPAVKESILELGIRFRPGERG